MVKDDVVNASPIKKNIIGLQTFLPELKRFSRIANDFNMVL